MLKILCYGHVLEQIQKLTDTTFIFLHWRSTKKSNIATPISALAVVMMHLNTTKAWELWSSNLGDYEARMCTAGVPAG